MARTSGRASVTENLEVGRVLSRLVARGHTLVELERLLQLSTGYLSKLRHHRAEPSAQLLALLSLLETNPSATAAALRRLGRRGPQAERSALRDVVAPAAGGVARAALLALVPELERRRVPWALGGAVALEAWGLARETTDIDIFVDDAHRAVLELFRNAGLAVAHYSDELAAAYPTVGGENDRIDIIFPGIEPAAGAVRRAERLTLQGVELPVLPAVDLAAMKLMSRRPKEHADALRLLDAGVAPRRAVRALLARLSAEPLGHRSWGHPLDPAAALARLEKAK